MPRAELICGPIGAGKTTYARRFASQLGALVLSTDDWIGRLFYMDLPKPHRPAWWLDRVDRCEAQMLELIAQAGGLGLDVVLDWGLARREHRDRARSALGPLGYATRLHFIDAPAELRRARVLDRNARRTATYSVHVDEGMFESMESYFEPPGADELSGGLCVNG